MRLSDQHIQFILLFFYASPWSILYLADYADFLNHVIYLCPAETTTPGTFTRRMPDNVFSCFVIVFYSVTTKVTWLLVWYSREWRRRNSRLLYIVHLIFIWFVYKPFYYACFCTPFLPIDAWALFWGVPCPKPFAYIVLLSLNYVYQSWRLLEWWFGDDEQSCTCALILFFMMLPYGCWLGF